MSFSTRPAKDGKKNLCLLDTIFENQVQCEISINPKVFSNYFILPSKVFDTLVQEGSWNYHKLNISQSEGERKCRQKRETCGSPNSNQIIVDGLRLKKMRGSDVSKDKEKNEDICQYFTSL